MERRKSTGVNKVCQKFSRKSFRSILLISKLGGKRSPGLLSLERRISIDYIPEKNKTAGSLVLNLQLTEKQRLSFIAPQLRSLQKKVHLAMAEIRIYCSEG